MKRIALLAVSALSLSGCLSTSGNAQHYDGPLDFHYPRSHGYGERYQQGHNGGSTMRPFDNRLHAPYRGTYRGWSDRMGGWQRGRD